MTEHDLPPEDPEVFDSLFEMAFGDFLEMNDYPQNEWVELRDESLNGQSADYTPYDGPVPIDLEAMGFENPTPEQWQRAKAIICAKFGLDTTNLEGSKIREYLTYIDEHITDSGLLVPATKVAVTVHQTNREGYFLQEMSRPEGLPTWFFGPDRNMSE